MSLNLASVVVVYHDYLDAMRCIEWVTKNVAAPIVVVDNSDGVSTLPAAMADRLSKLSVEVHYLRTTHNHGSAGGFSIGMLYAIEELGAEWIWLHDQDGFPAEDCYANLRGIVDQHYRVGIVAPVVRTVEYGDVHIGFRSRINAFGNPISLNDRRLRAGTWRELDLVGGAGILIAAQLIREIGTYDTNFFVGYEEYEFSLRARRNHWSILLAGEANYYHPDLYAKHGRRGAILSGGLCDWIKPLYLPLGGRGGEPKVKELAIILQRYGKWPLSYVSIVYSLCRNLLQSRDRTPSAVMREFSEEMKRATSADLRCLNDWRSSVRELRYMEGKNEAT